MPSPVTTTRRTSEPRRRSEQPDAKLVSYRIDIRRVMRGKLSLVIGDGTTSVDGRDIYTAKDLRVGLFTSTAGF